MSSVLIVDDEAGVRGSLGAVLRDEGYAVDTAESGEECLDRVEIRVRVGRSVRERGRRQEADELRADRAHPIDLHPHVLDAAVPEARLEHVRRLAERARVDAAARDLERVAAAEPGVETEQDLRP